MISSLPAIPKAAESIRRGSLTPIELVEFCLERIRRFEPQVRAWVLVDEVGARREAERLTQLAQRGEFIGPLHGIPLGIKDIIDIAGWPTKCGSRLRENRIAATDAEVVQGLRRAGAIFLGKTVTTEFASFDPPPTRNPWNLERTPGGSSSGSAAAVALEMCVAAVGTQTGGSIVRPASYCGVVGLKPSFGAVSLHGIEPLSWHMDHAGPITRTVADAAQLFKILRDDSERDHLETNESRTVLCQLTGGFFEERADPQIQRAFDSALKTLRAAGTVIESLDGKSIALEKISASHRCIMAVDAAEHHRSAFARSPDQFGPNIRTLIEEGRRLPVLDYAAALRHQAHVQTELEPLFANQRVLILPSTTTAAPGVESTGDPAFNSLWSFAGLPEITIPCGLTDDGMPCGIQLVGAAGTEEKLLAIAAMCESRIGFHSRPRILQVT